MPPKPEHLLHIHSFIFSTERVLDDLCANNTLRQNDVTRWRYVSKKDEDVREGGWGETPTLMINALELVPKPGVTTICGGGLPWHDVLATTTTATTTTTNNSKNTHTNNTNKSTHTNTNTTQHTTFRTGNAMEKAESASLVPRRSQPNQRGAQRCARGAGGRGKGARALYYRQ